MSETKTERICCECEYRDSFLINEGSDSQAIPQVALHIFCTKVEIKEITEHGETWFSAVREIRNTGIQQSWCPLINSKIQKKNREYMIEHGEAENNCSQLPELKEFQKNNKKH